jgi:predicted ribosome quality control (RQC) complex YloA/Tae2 family protein
MNPIKDDFQQEQQAIFDKKIAFIERQLKNHLKHLQRSQDRFSQELTEAQAWEALQHEANLLKANLFSIRKGMDKVHLHDWLTETQVEIILDPHTPASEEVDKRFRKSKKLKRAIDPLTKQVDLAKKNIDKTSTLLSQLPTLTTLDELKLFCQKNYLRFEPFIPKKSSDVKPDLLPYREYTTALGLKVWVGKSAKDNDKLTFSYANGSDYWLHVNGQPGSHVVLHLGKHKEADENSIQDAIQAALFFSKAKDAKEGEVCITQCKYVSHFGKNQPGKVQISNARTVYAKLDMERLKKLKERR